MKHDDLPLDGDAIPTVDLQPAEPVPFQEPEVRTSSFDILQFEEKPDDSEVELVLQNDTVRRTAPAESNKMRSVVIDHRKSLGEALITVRSAAGMQLDEVESKTKIKMSYLKALESDNEKELPQKVYIAAYVRSLCKVYRLDAATTDQLLAHLAEPSESDEVDTVEPTAIRTAPERGTRRPTGRRPGNIKLLLPLIVFLLIILALLVGVVWGISKLVSGSAANSERPTPSVQETSKPAVSNNTTVAPSTIPIRDIQPREERLPVTEVPER